MLHLWTAHLLLVPDTADKFATNTTNTAQYAAAAAKTSCLLAFVVVERAMENVATNIKIMVSLMPELLSRT